VVQQVAQWLLQQPREHEVQVGEVARQAAEREQQACAHALRARVGFGSDAAVDQCADAETDDGVGDIVHPAILPKSQASRLLSTCRSGSRDRGCVTCGTTRLVNISLPRRSQIMD